MVRGMGEKVDRQGNPFCWRVTLYYTEIDRSVFLHFCCFSPVFPLSHTFIYTFTLSLFLFYLFFLRVLGHKFSSLTVL